MLLNLVELVMVACVGYALACDAVHRVSVWFVPRLGGELDGEAWSVSATSQCLHATDNEFVFFRAGETMRTDHEKNKQARNRTRRSQATQSVNVE